ncbi:MAG TPA: mycofactocin-associated electron transfer flavoprotein beta subunit, partial [Acidimicrobiales bacterium]|nr:mycofactocin-associated electron transfer flavoprotein beta subunit [Acidimicrobiales bacterium]
MSFVAAAIKWVDLRARVDPLTGEVATDPLTSSVSDADLAALEWSLRLGEAWGWETVAVTAGPPGAEAVLRTALSAGVDRALRVDMAPDSPSASVAAGLAGALEGAGVVLCGDWSLDRGSGSVPPFLAARLGAAQACGLVGLEPGEAGTVVAERRLDGGRRERLRATSPAVLSVEGSTARLRRAAMPAVLASRSATVEVVRGPTGGPRPPVGRHRPLRPRPRVLPP